MVVFYSYVILPEGITSSHDPILSEGWFSGQNCRTKPHTGIWTLAATLTGKTSHAPGFWPIFFSWDNNTAKSCQKSGFFSLRFIRIFWVKSLNSRSLARHNANSRQPGRQFGIPIVGSTSQVFPVLNTMTFCLHPAFCGKQSFFLPNQGETVKPKKNMGMPPCRGLCFGPIWCGR